MPSLVDILSSSKPYVPPIQIAVIAKNPEDPQRCVIGDDTDALECIIYNDKVQHKFVQGASLLLINSFVRKFAHKPSNIEIRSNTRVSNTGRIVISDDIRNKGILLINPQPADFVKLDTIPTSPMKKLVSIRGQVVSVSI